MRKIFLTTLMVALALPAAAVEWATTIKSIEVVPGIYILQGANGFSSNMGLLVGDEHVLLIDDGVAAITDSLMAKVQELAGRPADFLVNTHAHDDHVGSNAMLAQNGTIVFAHDNLRKRLVETPEAAGGPAGIPVVTFADAVTFHVNGHEAYVFHIATAHTDGDAVIHFPDVNVIDAGDLFFNYMFPFIDIDSGGSVAGYKAGQQQIIDMADDDTAILPGHCPLANKSDLQAALDMLIDAEARVKNWSMPE